LKFVAAIAFATIAKAFQEGCAEKGREADGINLKGE